MSNGEKEPKPYMHGRDVNLNVRIPTTASKAFKSILTELGGSKILLETGGKITHQQICSVIFMWAKGEMDRRGVRWLEKELAPHLQVVALEIAKAKRKAKQSGPFAKSDIKKTGASPKTGGSPRTPRPPKESAE